MNAKALLASFVSLLAVTWCFAQTPPGTVLWTYEVYATAPLAIGNDRTIYVGSYWGIEAITNAGSSASRKWVFPLPAYRVTGVSVANDGTIYIANNTEKFYAVNSDGTQKWVYSFAGGGSCQPAIGRDGTIYVVADVVLYAMTPSGTKRWSFPIGDNAGIPAIAEDGTIYVRNRASSTNCFAFNPNGTLKWSAQLPSYSLFGVESGTGVGLAIGRDGTVYLAGAGLGAITPEGTQLWFSNANDFIGSVVGHDGIIYSGGFEYATLHALSTAGQSNWHVDFPIRCVFKFCAMPTTPAIDKTGTVYHCASNSIFAISAQGQVLWVVSHPNPQTSPILEMTSPAIAPDGTIYVTLTNTLFAIAGNNSPPDSPWPMFQQNARRTGKVEKPALLNSQRRGDANFQFQLYAQLGQTNAVETSTNLSTWSFLTSVVVTNVPMDVVDLTASNSPSRFYRAITP